MALNKDFINNKTLINQYISSGKNVLMFVPGHEDKVKQSTILNVTPSGFYIQKPFASALGLELKKGIVVNFKMFPHDGYFIEFSSKIRDVIVEETQDLLHFDFPHEMIKVQRRDSYRVPLNLEARVILKIKDSQMIDETASLIDISVGGALLATHLTPETGLFGNLLFHPGEGDPFEINFIVKRVKAVQTLKSTFPYTMGIEFTGISELSSQKLSRLITRLQIIERG